MINYTDKQMEILQRLNSLIDETGSQNKVAQMIGVSASVISSVRKGDYAGNTDAIFQKISEYFGVKAEAETTYSPIAYCDTFISSQIYEIIRLCHIKGGLSIVCGDAGIGKTKAVYKYAKDHPTNCTIITMNPCLTGAKTLLSVIAEKIEAEQRYSIPQLWNSVLNKLSDGMVLIFDEAQHMTLKNIETLRSFSDHFQNMGQTLGIVFVGNPETVHRMGVKRAEFAQIANRARQIKVYTTQQIVRDDIIKLFPPLKGHDKEIDYLYQIAQTRQGLRGTVNLFSNAWDNENITYEGLVAMTKFMEMEL